jgi:hypothetical protein
MVRKKQAFIASAIVGGLALLNPAGAAGINHRHASVPFGGRDLALAKRKVTDQASILLPPKKVFSSEDLHSFHVPIIKNSRNVENLLFDPGSIWSERQTKFLQDMAELLHGPTLSSPDPYGLVPGTHIASRFDESGVPLFLTKGSGFQKQDSPFENVAIHNNSRNSLYHHGVYLGNGWVLGFPEGLSTLEDFIGYNKLYYKVTYPRKIDQKDVVRRAVQVFYARRIDFGKGYDLFRKNCEHVATYIMTGTPQSLQVTRAKMIVLGIGSGLILALKAAQKASRKLMRSWGFKPGMNKHQIHEQYNKQIAKYSIMNRLRGRIPPQLTQARNTALQL